MMASVHRSGGKNWLRAVHWLLWLFRGSEFLAWRCAWRKAMLPGKLFAPAIRGAVGFTNQTKQTVEPMKLSQRQAEMLTNFPT